MEARFVESGGWLAPPRFESHYSVALLRSGTLDVSHRSSTEHFTPGWLKIFCPGEVFAATGMSSPGFSGVLLEISASVVHDVVDAVGAKNGLGDAMLLPPAWADSAAFRAAAGLARAIESKAAPLQQEVLLHALLAQIVGTDGSATCARTTDAKRILKARELLDHGYTRQVTLIELAALTGWSTFYFVRRFHEQTGVTPHKYLTLVRLGNARRLIRSGMPLAAVAGAVGFSDQSHLTRAFARTYGVTPGTYARQLSICDDKNVQSVAESSP